MRGTSKSLQEACEKVSKRMRRQLLKDSKGIEKPRKRRDRAVELGRGAIIGDGLLVKGEQHITDLQDLCYRAGGRDAVDQKALLLGAHALSHMKVFNPLLFFRNGNSLEGSYLPTFKGVWTASNLLKSHVFMSNGKQFKGNTPETQDVT